MAKDLHKTDFDEGTLAKLELYRMYLREWLPVFLRATSRFKTINVFDFFAGPGTSPSGQPGSPLITVEEVKNYYKDLREKDLQLTLYFNEYIKAKHAELVENLPDDTKLPFRIVTRSDDFPIAFSDWLPLMQGAANLVFLDQNGIKQITPDVFKQLVSTKGTDFLFFISSSFFHRFGEQPEFKKHLGITREEIAAGEYSNVHRNITEFYRGLVPDGVDYFLAPFSIKKDANIHGLVFGTSAPLGMLKYLTCTWKIDSDTGDSNFDIDQDNLDQYRNSNQQVLGFMDLRPTKVAAFEVELAEKILSGAFNTDQDILLYALQRGFIGKHVSPVVKKLTKEGKICTPNGERLRFSRDTFKGPRKFRLSDEPVVN